MSASLAGLPFRVNPDSVKWPYSLKLSTKETIGGRVVQLLGVSLGDLTVQGVFGRGGPEEQQAFFDRLKELVDRQMPANTDNPRPVRFSWPERRWDFWCYIKSFTQVGASTSIKASNLDFNPGYELVMFIQEDNGDITRAARDSASSTFIARLSAGMGWKATDYNGVQTLQGALQGQTVFEAIVSTKQLNVSFANRAEFEEAQGPGGD